MKTEYTPGPWINSNGSILASHPGHTLHVAKVYDTARFSGSLEANAQLISAAPDLLLACQVALEYLESQNHPRNLEEQVAFKAHQKEILQAAIAKATGSPITH